jgi:hypothetical protein
MIQSKPRLDAYRLSRSQAYRQLPCSRLPASHKTYQPCQSSTLRSPTARAKRKQARTSTMQCMVDPARCAPGDPHHHILTLLGMAWRGMANEHSTKARKRPLTSASSSERESQSGPVILDMGKSQVGRPLKVRYTTCFVFGPIGNIITNTGCLGCHLSVCLSVVVPIYGRPTGEHKVCLWCCY